MTDNNRFEILGNAGRLINSSLDLGSVLEKVIDSISSGGTLAIWEPAAVVEGG